MHDVATISVMNEGQRSATERARGRAVVALRRVVPWLRQVSVDLGFGARTPEYSWVKRARDQWMPDLPMTSSNMSGMATRHEVAATSLSRADIVYVTEVDASETTRSRESGANDHRDYWIDERRPGVPAYVSLRELRIYLTPSFFSVDARSFQAFVSLLVGIPFDVARVRSRAARTGRRAAP